MIIVVIQCIILVAITLLSIVGNVFVIAAILLERSLQKVSNYLIVSLAVADLLVGCLVMPLGVVNEVNNGWFYGPDLCDFWTSCDVLCCTASILNLVAIALDRYWAVTNINYVRIRTSRHIITMIIIAWSIAVVVALAPQFGWKDQDSLTRVNVEHLCIPTTDIGYQLFSYSTTLFIPLPVILVLYWKIYQVARTSSKWRREQRIAVCGLPMKTVNSNSNNDAFGRFVNSQKSNLSTENNQDHFQVDNVNLAQTQITIEDQSVSYRIDTTDDDSMTSSIENQSEEPTGLNSPAENVENAFSRQMLNQNMSGIVTNKFSLYHGASCHSTKQPPLNNKGSTFSLIISTLQKKCNYSLKNISSQNHDDKNERKAAKVLAIITGSFIVCWLPFFIMNFLMTRFNVNDINPLLYILLSWLPYFNSTLNPIIYTVFSPEFRVAFKRLLRCDCCHRWHQK